MRACATFGTRILRQMASRKALARIIAFGILLALAGCSYLQGKSEKDREADRWPEERLYRSAKDRLDTGTCADAIEFYEKLRAHYPFGPYTQHAQLELAYCYYRTGEPGSAVAALDRFIKLHPAHPHMAYARYLRGLIHFGAQLGIADRYLPKDPSQRDPGAARQAFQDFSDLIRQFPDSIYVDDAQLRMRHLRNILAQHEVNVANFYMRRGAFVAAANRARYVIENYQQAPAMPEALVLLAKSYKVLELYALADDALRVLELNYPNHPGVAEVEATAVD